MEYLYLLTLTTSILGLTYADYRHKLALFHNARRALITLAGSIFFFLTWDLAGVALGIFSSNQDLVSGLNLVHPDIPLEELLFLILFTYLTLLLMRARSC